MSLDRHRNKLSDEEPDGDYDAYGDGSPRSPDGAAKEGQSLFRKFTSSFRNKNSKPDKKQQIQEYREQIRRLSTRLDKVLREKDALKLVLTDILRKNSYYEHIEGENIQIGTTNQQFIIEGDPQLSETIDQLNAHMELLTRNLDENIEERAKVEKSCKESQVLLKETKDGIRKFKRRFDQKSAVDSNQFSELQLMLRSLTGDRSDENVITEGVEALRTYDNNDQYSRFDLLPGPAQLAIMRIVNKFDIPLSEFARYFEISKDDIKNDDRIKEVVLNRDTCAIIILRWVLADHGHGADKLVSILKKIDKENTEYMVQVRKHQIGSAYRDSLSISSVSTISSLQKRYQSPMDLLPGMKTKIDEMHAKYIGAGTPLSTIVVADKEEFV